jgi:hypothetical protein
MLPIAVGIAPKDVPSGSRMGCVLRATVCSRGLARADNSLAQIRKTRAALAPIYARRMSPRLDSARA